MALELWLVGRFLSHLKTEIQGAGFDNYICIWDPSAGCLSEPVFSNPGCNAFERQDVLADRDSG